MPEELWTEDRDIVQEVVIQTIPKKKKCKKAKWLSKEVLQIAEKGRKVKGKGEKSRYSHPNSEFQRKARRGKKAFLSDQCKEIEENNRMGKSGDPFSGEGNGNPLQYSCLENPRDGGAWWAAIYVVAQSQT